MAVNLLDDVDTSCTERVLGDKAYDSDAIWERIEELGADAVIPSKSNRRKPKSLRKRTYRKRHRVENLFCSIKQFRSVAARYEKMALHYAGIASRACTVLRLKK